ncbi:MAG TPA: hypothetical protein VKE41_09690 [Roseiflexaceae bacterium]|nr:hypothetical protein [Roseiflexaceae bacterium]
MARCQDCGEYSPEQASFCKVCGARLVAPTARVRAPLYTAIGPTVRLRATDSAPSAAAAPTPLDRAGKHGARPGLAQALIPLIGLIFGIVVVIGIAQLIALSSLHAATIWPIGALIAGVLLAESAWVNGQLWRGLRGMLLWGGLIGLLAFGQLFPWALALAIGWLALHPGWYGRHS